MFMGTYTIAVLKAVAEGLTAVGAGLMVFSITLAVPGNTAGRDVMLLSLGNGAGKMPAGEKMQTLTLAFTAFRAGAAQYNSAAVVLIAHIAHAAQAFVCAVAV